MVDVRSILSALKIGWLKRIMCDNGKIKKLLQIMCPLVQDIRKCGWEFVNTMQRVGNPFGENVFEHLKKKIKNWVLNVFLQILMNLLQNVCIMLIFAGIKKKVIVNKK